MKRLLALGLVIGLFGVVSTIPAASADTAKKKEALRELQEFIGSWKLNVQTKARPGPRDPFWEEKVQWGWKFKADDCWLTINFVGGKFLKSGEVRFLPDKKKYELTGTSIDGKDKLVFVGELKDDKLIFERTDPKTKDVQRFRMNTTNEGIRLAYNVERRTESGTIWKLEYMGAGNKEGKSIGGKKVKGPECVVSGGLGTMTVSYNGETFYVCCSGCADAFKENPKKYVDEFKKAKGKK